MHLRKWWNARLLVAVMLSVLLVSCATYRTVRSTAPVDSTAAPPAEGMKIAGYTTTDGVYHRFEGTVRAEGDSMAFYSPAKAEKGLELEKPEQSFRLARAEVFSAKNIAGTDIVLTTLLVVVLAAGVMLMLVAGAMSSEESMM